MPAEGARENHVPFVEERWTLTVTFDLMEDQDKSDQGEYRGVDEAFRFARYAATLSGGLWEEVREMMKWPKGSRTVTVTSDVLDYLCTLQTWVTYHTIPRQMKLVRNDGSRGV
ncbi:hypothetical protein PP631_gp055 [Streptomyces phage KimJongPhill]|jgi:hypothetical protein|uniref:Uncharacterized protein n=1 Tax=Streptomyces phage KimJongPhill TaxID=2848886 RepID=A0A8F2E6S9_9CAUD|nr:hypothetical protein PP631_gp055 [Streptomyces phage KimJongPhill]QWT29836.1 hypothetical protein SEA_KIMJONGPHILL_55 [Streptomyces phage KimJongPhill]